MAIAQAYQKTLKRRVIQRFVRDNKRSPTETELRELVKREHGAYPSVNQVGISGYDLVYPQFGKPSSASAENTNRQALIDDVLTLNSRISNIAEKLEDSFRGFYSTARRTSNLLTVIESRVDNLLLLNSSVDVFVNGVEEDFSSQDAVQLDDSDATVEAGYATLGRTGYSAVDLSQVKIKASAVAERGIKGQTATNPLESLKEDDGSFWEYLVYTDYSQGRVSLVLEIEFPDPEYVGEIRLGVAPINTNRQMTATLMYSFDGQTFSAHEPVEQPVTRQELMFNLGLESVKRVRILLSKDAADSKTSSNNQDVYVFSIDSLKIYSDKYTDSSFSTLVMGPYDILDAEGKPVYFTKAALSACAIEPEDTSIAFFLSVDREDWQSVSVDSDSLQYLSFADGSSTQSVGLVDGSLKGGALLEGVDGLEEVNFADEAVLNTYVDSTYSGLVPLRSIVIKRNTPEDGASEILGVAPGWFLDTETAQYITTVYVATPEGRYIDFGSTGITVNGTPMSGEVHLKQGYSLLSTADSNWQEIIVGITDIESLKANDPLYPYNHRYLIEGYPYTSAFSGDQIYTGVDEYFGRKLEYVAPEFFAFLDTTDDNYWTAFTIENVDGNLYFKVKVNKGDASWLEERVVPDWSVQSASSNQVYVKLVFSSSNSECSPVVESFKVRVI